MISFREYLAEEITDKLSHFTSFEGLLDILKKGYIKGKSYDRNKISMSKTKDFEKTKAEKLHDKMLEFCLIRKSSKKGILDVAEHVPQVEIVFDWDNILNLRNVRKPYPIAEIPMLTKDRIIDWTNELIKKNYIEEKDRQYFLNLFLNLKNGFDNNLKSAMEIHDLPNKFPKLKSEEGEKLIKELFTFARRKRHYQTEREGEERIDLSRNVIPVSSKYMKIIIPKDIDDYKPLNKAIEQYKEKDPGLFEYKEKI